MVDERKGKGKGRSRPQPSGDDDEIQQRTMPNKCPPYCSRFTCKVDDNCHNECERLDFAQAMICELCANPCDNEKQKKIFLNTKYYEDKKKEFSKNIMDGVKGIRTRHTYLETRLKELRMQNLKTSWYKFGKKRSISAEGNKIRFELEIVRRDMDLLEIPYTTEVNLD